MLNRKEYLEQAAQLTKPHIGTRTAFWFDLDFVEFKLFNYHYSVEEGNNLIAETELFFNKLPGVCLFKRIFSDEFVFLVITEEPRSDDEIVALANSYIYAFLESKQGYYPICNLKLSCGICPVFSEVPMEAIDNASLARKQSRADDAATAVIFSEEKLDELESHRQLEKETALAMQERRVVFDLQPKVNIRTGEIVGAEALARQISREGERIYPNVFMDIMEENGMVVELDFMVLEKTCDFIADRLKQGLPVVRTSVNLSRLHLLNPTTADLLHAIVQKYDVPAEYLEFELTETVFLAELTSAKALIDRLHTYGYATSIDDFGSGYAGLNLCQEVDFDIIKLDRRFLSDDEQLKKKNAAIIPCIVDMMNRLGIKVVCEGAERAEQCEFLLTTGCEIVQGYYFSKPIPPEQFYDIYEKQNGRYSLPASRIAPVLCGDSSDEEQSREMQ